MTSLPTFNYKLVLLGDSGVGKSCLVVRFVKDEYAGGLPTLGGIFFEVFIYIYIYLFSIIFITIIDIG